MFSNPWHPCKSRQPLVAASGPPLPPLKTRLIVNPRSHHAARHLGILRTFARQQSAELLLTERSRQASAFADQAVAAGCELIVAVGGDGTMNEIAARLVGTPAILGLVPCGSGDGLGRHLGLHGPIPRALEILRTGRPRLIDSATADGHPFFSAAGIGFEAEIAQRFNQLERRGLGRYLTTAAVVARSWQPQECVVTHAGRSERLTAFSLVVTNSGQYGNNARVAPDARVDDGRIELCTIPPLSPWNVLPLGLRLFLGFLPGGRGVHLRQAGHFVVERPRPGLLHTDGELHDAGTRLEFAVRPASLRVMCPP